MYSAEIVADTINSSRERITTFEIEMPKWLVAEYNTHRSFCRNSASSRAIPTKQIIERIMTDPVIPIDFRSKNTGMVADQILSSEDYTRAVFLWLQARDQSVSIVEEMMRIGDGIDKQRVNRLLEPWMFTKIVSTATEYDNFFTLRDSPEAQPEFGYIAHLMHELYKSNTPKLDVVHFPYVEKWSTKYVRVFVDGELIYLWVDALVSAARCGRVSYYRQGVTKSVDEDIARAVDFITQRHMSPIEHPAFAEPGKRYGPFIGWRPLRSFIPGESGSKK